MHVIALKTLRQFWERHPDAEQSLRDWHKQAESANWQSPLQVKADYPSASIIGNNRVVFNIKGNNYRLVTYILYKYSVVYVRFIGTHAEYDRTNALEI